MTKEQEVLDEILEELTRARNKFPGKNVTFAALVEEHRELASKIRKVLEPVFPVVMEMVNV